MTADLWQARLEHLQSRGRLPSVVAGVLRGGALVWVGAAGDVPGPDPADVQYRIGSITKTLVAVAVLRCRDDGLIGLDDPIGSVVPETGYAAATFRDLLSHASGMQSEPAGSWWERSPGTGTDALLAANDGGGAVAGPGEFFHYSNLGFALLGEAVARLRGAPWWEVVSSGLLAPLGMTRTTYHPQAPHADGRSVDHFAGTLTAEPHQDTGAMAPAGQAWSTLADLARWAGFLASGHPGVLSAETLREAGTPALAPDYGLGLRVVEVGGRTMVGHTGSMPGFQASLFVEPGSGDGCVALASSTTGLDTDGVPGTLLGPGPAPDPEPAWVPTGRLPEAAAELLGLWFWGNTAFEARWHNDALHLHNLALAAREETFVPDGEHWRGTDGYHRGEPLTVHRRADGSVSHLVCATFVYTRVPYDPDVEVPGGHPTR